MKINSSAMQNIISHASKASDSTLKNLDDVTERKMLMAISEALRQGKTSMSVDRKTLESIQAKLITPGQAKNSTFSEKIYKVFMNIFGGRVSSSSLKDEVQNAQSYIHKNIQNKMESKQKELKDLEQSSNSNEKKIDAVKIEIKDLYAEKLKLDVISMPLKFKKAADDFMKNRMPAILDNAKKISNNQELTEIIEQTFYKSNLNDIGTQFETDFKRDGITLTLIDETKGTFIGSSKNMEATDTRFEEHVTAFEKLFSQDESQWKILTQEGVSQTPLNFLGFPLTFEFMGNMDANKFQIGRDEFVVIGDASTGKKNITAEIKRNEDGDIVAIECKALLKTPIAIGNSYDLPTDVMGHITSSVEYTLTLKNGKPRVTVNRFDHQYSDKPTPLPLQMPGFKEVKSEEALQFEQKLAKYEKQLSDLKSDPQKTNKEKLNLINNFMGALETIIKSSPSDKLAQLGDDLLKKFQSYRDEILITPSKMQQTVQQFNEKMPAILDNVKKNTSDSLGYLEKSIKDNFATKDNEQFKIDYRRLGTQLTLTDNTKRPFQGVQQDNQTEENRLQSHLDAFDTFFAPDEAEWKLLTEQAVTQSALIRLGMPLSVEFAANMDKYKIDNNLMICDVKNGNNSIQAHINRDYGGNITSITCRAQMHTPIAIGPSYDKPKDVIGAVDSFLDYTVTLQQGVPVVTVNGFNYEFTESDQRI